MVNCSPFFTSLQAKNARRGMYFMVSIKRSFSVGQSEGEAYFLFFCALFGNSKVVQFGRQEWLKNRPRLPLCVGSMEYRFAYTLPVMSCK